MRIAHGVDRREALLEAVDIARRLRVRLAEERLAEVRPLLSEAADEALHAGDPDAHAGTGRIACERSSTTTPASASARRRSSGRSDCQSWLPSTATTGNLDREASIATTRHLVDLPVLRQVARKQHEVGLGLDALERLAHTIAVVRAGVDVACGRNTNRLRHGRSSYPGLEDARRGNLTGPCPATSSSSRFSVAMKIAAATLRDGGIPFALAGGLAVYARGGPPTEHDVDFVLRQEDAERALELLGDAGFRAERPPEGWLYKVYDDERDR